MYCFSAIVLLLRNAAGNYKTVKVKAPLPINRLKIFYYPTGILNYDFCLLSVRDG